MEVQGEGTTLVLATAGMNSEFKCIFLWQQFSLFQVLAGKDAVFSL